MSVGSRWLLSGLPSFTLIRSGNNVLIDEVQIRYDGAEGEGSVV